MLCLRNGFRADRKSAPGGLGRGRLNQRHRTQKRSAAVKPLMVASRAQHIESAVRALSPDQLLDRYHDLIDMRLMGTIRFPEAFELSCVEARLDMADAAELGQLTDFQNAWQREQDGWIASAEHLLARIKAGK